MTLPLLSTWIGIAAYSLIVGLSIIWVGISLANWLTRHALCVVALGGGALCFAVYFAGLIIIASDWFPAFSGLYVALFLRCIALTGALLLLAFTAIYLNHKRRQEPC